MAEAAGTFWVGTVLRKGRRELEATLANEEPSGPRSSPGGGAACDRRETAWRRLLPPQDGQTDPGACPSSPGRFHTCGAVPESSHSKCVFSAGCGPLSAALPAPASREVRAAGPRPGLNLPGQRGALGGESLSTQGSFPKMGRGQSLGSRSQERRRCPGSKKELGCHGTRGSETRRCPQRT